MAFFGAVLTQGTREAIKVHINDSLTVSNAVVDLNQQKKGSVEVRAKPANSSAKDGFILCRLTNDTTNNQGAVNVKFSASDSPVEFWFVGGGQVHLTGFFEHAEKIQPAKPAAAIAPVADNSVEKKEEKVLTATKKRKAESATDNSEVSAKVSKAKTSSGSDEPDAQPKTVNMKKPWNVKPQNDEGVCVEKPKVTFKVKGLSFIDYVIGNGEVPKPGAAVKVVYTGLLPDGTVFDSRLKRTQPLVFRKGVNQVVKGLDLGMEGMKAGGSREITVPAELG